MNMTALRTTPLTAWHQAHGGKLVEFAGYHMPVRYQEGVIAEHQAVRQRCGIFDVSHMGELEIRGADARSAVDRLVTNDVTKLEVGQVLYSAMCRPTGVVLDDVLVYCLGEEHFMIVCNASNHAKVAAWVGGQLQGDALLDDQTLATALFAVQGPASLDVLRAWPRAQHHLGRLAQLDYYRCVFLDFDGIEILISRTGYTGERGYELYLPVAHAVAVWEELIVAGTAHGLVPIGLGARDTLRLEAGYSLYGHELDEETTPLEAGIGWVVKLGTSDFIGRDALVAQKEQGVPRRTVALSLAGRNIPRQGSPVLHEGRAVGAITSGTFSPVLEHGIGLARIESAAAGGPLAVELRGQAIEADTVKLPFVPSRVK